MIGCELCAKLHLSADQRDESGGSSPRWTDATRLFALGIALPLAKLIMVSVIKSLRPISLSVLHSSPFSDHIKCDSKNRRLIPSFSF